VFRFGISPWGYATHWVSLAGEEFDRAPPECAGQRVAMLRLLLALVLFCLLLCAGLVALSLGVRALAAVGANGLMLPLWGLGFLSLSPLAFIVAGRLAMRICRGEPAR
jgi:hypothetical protein